MNYPAHSKDVSDRYIAAFRFFLSLLKDILINLMTELQKMKKNSSLIILTDLFGRIIRNLMNQSDSFEAHDDEDLGDSSVEYADLSPPDLQAYLYGRNIKKGFNAWAGKRQLKRFLRNRHGMSPMNRQRRKPWGGSA